MKEFSIFTTEEKYLHVPDWYADILGNVILPHINAIPTIWTIPYTMLAKHMGGKMDMSNNPPDFPPTYHNFYMYAKVRLPNDCPLVQHLITSARAKGYNVSASQSYNHIADLGGSRFSPHATPDALLADSLLLVFCTMSRIFIQSLLYDDRRKGWASSPHCDNGTSAHDTIFHLVNKSLCPQNKFFIMQQDNKQYIRSLFSSWIPIKRHLDENEEFAITIPL